MSTLDKFLKFTASLKLAVIVIVGLAVISAVGTITEARYDDAHVAQQLVYQSSWMMFILGLLCVNLIGVMIDRWPWKQHHTGFVLAHIGILLLLFGSWLTQRYGIDGSMAFEIGESNRFITTQERDISVIASLDGQSFHTVYEKQADFLRNPPTPEKPFFIRVGEDEIKVIDYYHFAFREVEVVPSEAEMDGPAIRFQLENPNVNMTEWIRRDRTKAEAELNLGPARIVLARGPVEPTGANEILLTVTEGSKTIRFAIYNKDKSLRLKGVVKESETLDTGWMGLKFRVLRFLPHAKEDVKFTKLERSSPLAVSAMKFEFKGQTYWLGLNSTQRLYLPDRVYFMSFANRRLELNFALKLNKFTMDTYQGTDRAATYESEVEVPDRGPIVISMNEPLKKDGFTFYQSSFQRNDKGEAVVSILSVNHDPGRWIKYLGSMLIVFGSIILFWFKRVKFLNLLKGVNT